MAGKSEDAAPTGLKVIGAGFGRTGTASMKEAMEILDMRCYHMFELLKMGLSEGRKWDLMLDEKLRLIEAGKPDEMVTTDRKVWDTIFGDWEATVDLPAALFYRELKAAYPEAKVILNVRDPESWFRSLRRTIAKQMHEPWFYKVYELVGLIDPMARWLAHTANSKLWAVTCGEAGYEAMAITDKEKACKIFEMHTEAVKKYIPAEDLLIFENKQGWGPICKFLGVDTPDQEFPFVNDEFRFRMHFEVGYYLKAAAMLVGIGSVLVAIPYGVKKLMR